MLTGIYDAVMDISGRIRSLLAALPLDSRPHDIFAAIAARVVKGQANPFREYGVRPEERWAHEQLAKTLILRMQASDRVPAKDVRCQAEAQLQAGLREPAAALESLGADIERASPRRCG